MAQQRQKKYFDASHTPLKLQIGETVRVYYPIRKARLCESFMHRWLGPYTVLAQFGPQTYHLRRTSTSSETIAHICRIKRVHVATPDVSHDMSTEH